MSKPRVALVGADGGLVDTPAARPRRFSLKVGIIGGAAALAIAAGGMAWLQGSSGGSSSVLAASSPVSTKVLEEQYGAKVQMVGLLAAGGLIELRFQVVDADKAMALFGPVDEMPLLAVEGTDTVLTSAKGMKHHMTLLDGGSYFIFYTNAANAVQEGSQVSMIINGVRLEHIVVQK